MLIALLALVGFFVALYLTLYKLGIIGDLNCAVGSCEAVNTSRYATLLGLPVAAWGMGTYALLLALALLGLQEGFATSRAIAWGLAAVSGWSVVFSGWLTYLELFVIQAICMWCVTSAVIVTLIFAASLVDLRRAGGPAGRRAVEPKETAELHSADV